VEKSTFNSRNFDGISRANGVSEQRALSGPSDEDQSGVSENLTNDTVVLSVVKNQAKFDAEKFVNCVNPLQSIALTDGHTQTTLAYLNAALAQNTRRAYQQDLADFLGWGGCIPCSPDVLAAFITDRAAVLSPHTVSRRVVGVSRAHTGAGHPDPAKNDLIRTLLRGIRRAHGRPQRQVAPLLRADLELLLPHMHSTKGVRDRALLLLGFAAALRRSELAAISCTDIAFVREGLILTLPRSKSDQEGAGRKIGVPWGRTEVCAVRAVKGWLDHSQITEGAVFRSVHKGGQVSAERLSSQSVALLVKDYAAKAGLPANQFSGHSLRSGLVTSAAQAGVPAHQIMAQTGHRSMDMLNRYIREANLFKNNSAGAVL
jgi:integrase